MDQRKPPIRAIRLEEVCEKTGLGRSSIYKMVEEGRFPRNFKCGKRASVWFEHEIDGWLLAQARAREEGP